MNIGVILQSTPRSDGTHAVLIRLNGNGKRKYITTNVCVSKKDFNPKAKFGSWIRSSNLRNKLYNATIIAEIHRLEDAIEQAKPQTIENIISYYRGFMGQDIGIVKFTHNYFEKNTSRYKPASLDAYKAFIRDIINFTGENDIPIKKIDTDFLESLYNYCRKNGNMYSTINHKFKKLSTIFNEAIRSKIINQNDNPFIGFKEMKSEKTKRAKLTEDELNKIRELELKSGSKIWHAKNIFLLQFNLAGMRVSDILTLKYQDIIDDRVTYEMNKTGHIQSLKLNAEAKDILEFYIRKNAKKTDYVFPFIPNLDLPLAIILKKIKSTTVVVNINLKKIAKMVGIEKSLSTHVARHTFASIASRKVKDIMVVSKLLGHSSVVTTQGYIASLSDKEIDSALEKIYGAEKRLPN